MLRFVAQAAADDAGDRARVASRWVLVVLKHSAALGTPERFHYLIEAVLLADCLKQDSQLREVLKRAVRIMLPAPVALECLAQLDTARVFDKSEISRGRLSVDVAVMLLRRQLNHNGGVGSKSFFCIVRRSLPSPPFVFWPRIRLVTTVCFMPIGQERRQGSRPSATS
jgi:hypothetical protein